MFINVTIGPKVAFSVVPEPAWIGQTVTFDASSSSDANGTIVSYHWFFGDGTNSTGKVTTHVFNTSGMVGILLRILDDRGLYDVASKTIQVGNDPNPPVSVAILTGGVVGENGWFRSAVTVRLRATDDVSGVAALYFRIDGAPWQNYSSILTIGEGAHLLEYFARDYADHVEMIHSLWVRVDGGAPKIVRLSPTGVITTANVTISWNATDSVSGISRYELSVDGGAFEFLTTNSSTVNLADGSHRAYLRAVDKAGNVAEATVMFEVRTGTVPSALNFFGGWVLYVLATIGAATGITFVLLWRRRRRPGMGTSTSLTPLHPEPPGSTGPPRV
jgi:hypothetical protein